MTDDTGASVCESRRLGEAAAVERLGTRSVRMHAELGVTGPQRLVLRIVGHHGRISAGTLADVLHIHPSSLTGMLQRLEQAELIRRESDPFDRRRALFELTRRGIRFNDERQGTIEASIAGALSKMSKEKLAGAKGRAQGHRGLSRGR